MVMSLMKKTCIMKSSAWRAFPKLQKEGKKASLENPRDVFIGEIIDQLYCGY